MPCGSGPYAPCWGLAACHGYEWGCRCWSCVLVDIEAEAADIRAAMLAEWERNGAIAAKEALETNV